MLLALFPACLRVCHLSVAGWTLGLRGSLLCPSNARQEPPIPPRLPPQRSMLPEVTGLPEQGFERRGQTLLVIPLAAAAGLALAVGGTDAGSLRKEGADAGLMPAFAVAGPPFRGGCGGGLYPPMHVLYVTASSAGDSPIAKIDEPVPPPPAPARAPVMTASRLPRFRQSQRVAKRPSADGVLIGSPLSFADNLTGSPIALQDAG